MFLRQGQVESPEWVTWADPEIFRVLPFPVVAGNLNTALERPDAVVLTRSLALKYFGHEDVIEADAARRSQARIRRHCGSRRPAGVAIQRLGDVPVRQCSLSPRYDYGPCPVECGGQRGDGQPRADVRAPCAGASLSQIQSGDAGHAEARVATQAAGYGLRARAGAHRRARIPTPSSIRRCVHASC